MSAALTPPSRVEVWRVRTQGAGLVLWLLLASLAMSTSQHRVLVVAPWLLLLLHGQGAAPAARRLWQDWRVPVIASLVLAAWLALGARLGTPPLESRFEGAAIALLWIPVAMLVLMQREAGRALEAALALAISLVVLACAIRMGHQAFIRGVPRPWGFTHNVLVGPLMLALALVAMALLRRSAWPPRRVAGVSAGLMVLAIAIAVLSNARTPLVAAGVVGLCILLAWRLRPSRRAWIGIALATLAWFAWTGARWQLVVVQSLQYEATTHKTSIGARLDMYRWALAHVDGLPWFGFTEAGLAERMNQRYLEFGLAPEQIWELIHMHNDVMQTSFAHGLVAGLSYAAFLLAILWGLHARRHPARVDGDRDAGRTDPVSALCAGAVLLLAVAGLFDSFLYWPKVWVALQAVMALAMALNMAATPARARAAGA